MERTEPIQTTGWKLKAKARIVINPEGHIIVRADKLRNLERVIGIVEKYDSPVLAVTQKVFSFFKGTIKVSFTDMNTSSWYKLLADISGKPEDVGKDFSVQTRISLNNKSYDLIEGEFVSFFAKVSTRTKRPYKFVIKIQKPVEEVENPSVKRIITIRKFEFTL